MNKEIWKELKRFEKRYLISNKGRVYSKCYKRILKTHISSHGYVRCGLYDGSKRYVCVIHRLVMKTFVGESFLQVNHKDGNKENNSVENLEYVDNRANIIHWRISKNNFIGSYCKKLKKWKTSINIGYEKKHLGYFETQQEAHNIYMNARKELEGK